MKWKSDYILYPKGQIIFDIIITQHHNSEGESVSEHYFTFGQVLNLWHWSWVRLKTVDCVDLLCKVLILVSCLVFSCGQVKQWAVWTWGTSLHPTRVTVVKALTSWVLKAATRRETRRTAVTPRTRSTPLCRLLSPPLRCSGTSHLPSAYIAKMYVIYHVCNCCVSCQSYCL